MRLELQKQSLEHKQEMKQIESKKAATISELQAQITEALREEEKLKAESSRLRQELETHKKPMIETAKAGTLLPPVNDPGKLVEAAKGMKLAELQYVQYQIYSMLNSMYKMYPPQPGYYPY